MGSKRRLLALRRGTLAVVLGGAVAVSSPAWGQTDDQRAGARAAATAGAQAFMERRWADSVDLFARAESLVHSPVHLLYIARSFEKLGALVKAREAYIRVTNEDLPGSAPGPVREAKADAERELEALEPRVPYVSVVVQGAGPRPVTVTMDGVPVPPALLGVPRPVDPGEHRFEATAQGMESARSVITVREKRSETVVLTLNPAAPGAAPAPLPAAAPAAAAAPPPPGPAPAAAPAPLGFEAAPAAPPAADSGGGGGPSPFTWVAYGVGAVGLGIGTAFAFMAKSAADDAKSKPCTELGTDGESDWCPAELKGFEEDHKSNKTIAIVGFAVGGVGVATGTILLIATSKKKKETASTFQPWVGLGSAGVRGRF